MTAATREQEAAQRIIAAWEVYSLAIYEQEPDTRDLWKAATETTRTECQRLADDIRGFLPKEDK